MSLLASNPSTPEVPLGLQSLYGLNDYAKQVNSMFPRPTPVVPSIAPVQGVQPQLPQITVKNPAIQRAITGLFNEASAPATLAPKGVVSTVKNPGQATAIKNLGTTMQAANAAANDSITAFTKQLLASRPSLQRASEQEASAAEAYYTTGPGSVQDQLARQGVQSKAAINMAVREAMNNARRGDSMRRMAGGNNSYNDAIYGDTLARIAAEQAQKKAEIDRQNLMYLLDARRNQTGARSKIIDDLLRREAEAAGVYRQNAGDESALLSSLMNLENSNTVYDVEDPETRIAKKLGLIGSLSDLDLARQQYGLN